MGSSQPDAPQSGVYNSPSSTPKPPVLSLCRATPSRNRPHHLSPSLPNATPIDAPIRDEQLAIAGFETMYTTASRVLMSRAALAGRGFHTTARRMADAPLVAKKPMGAFRGRYAALVMQSLVAFAAVC